MDKLEEILATRRVRVEEDKKKISVSEMERLAKAQPSPIDFYSAIKQSNRISVIAEMKRRSPSAGSIRSDYDVPVIAKAYEAGGASALSVLTEPDFFGGSIDDLKKAHGASALPILRKDFVFDPYQVMEAKACGASAVLLIADMLSPSLLKELAACVVEWGLAALVEVFTPQALEVALSTGSKVIGINSRDLRTLKMNPERVVELSARVPLDRLVVAESGIGTVRDMERLKLLNVGSVLVGESLMKQNDLAAAVQVLVKAGER
ncbi:MAG: Indole-3-glycerol phosphate synthase [Elusimicrobia bacterium]|nr:Indole-3-glycerol phosphate synthase [Elusimicrobiota bacterium]